MPESKVNKNFRVLREGMKKNRKHIEALNMAFNERLQQQQQNINNFKNAIGDDNRQRDQNISEISHNLALLKSFVTEKLSNHPNDYMNFANHPSSQPINNSIVPIGGSPIQGGKRKTRKRKNKKKRTRRVKRKTRRKKEQEDPKEVVLEFIHDQLKMRISLTLNQTEEEGKHYGVNIRSIFETYLGQELFELENYH